MKIAMVASEVSPYAKTGGLGDVVGSLPKALEKQGCDVKVFVPKYSIIDDAKYDFHYEFSIGEMSIRVNGKTRSVHVLKSKLDASNVDIYFIDCPHYFNRRSIYTSDLDEDERFVLFSKAVIEACQRLAWAPDVVHCNDWQTGLIPVLVKDNYSWDHLFDHTAFLMSIHNIAYQGRFPPETLHKAELRPELFYPNGPLEFHGSLSFMKIGIVYSEVISAVSPTYAKEILTYDYGNGMNDVLWFRQDDLFGVINGVDNDVWDPETDRHIPFHYSAKDLTNKCKNKEYLLKNTPLKFNKEIPLIGMITRMVTQKGINLIADAIHALSSLNAQWVILGSGEDRYENMFRSICEAMPHKFWSYIGFSTELAHLIEAGADMFLMPSLYEPCGLNQMYSLRYGTIPIVRKTGGLADTVRDWDEFNANGLGTGNGFSFEEPSGHALFSTVKRAVDTLRDEKTKMRIQLNGMSEDYSWDASAKEYIRLYEKAIAKRNVILRKKT